MLAPNSSIKQTAKKALMPTFLQSVTVGCVIVFAWFIGLLASTLGSVAFGTIGYVVMLLALVVLVLFPLFLGAVNYFRHLTHEQKESVVVIFKYFSNFKEYKRALRFSLCMLLKYGLAALLVFSPCITIALLSNEAVYDALNISMPVWVSNLWALNSFMVILGIVSLIFLTLKYYLASFIFVSNDTISGADAVKFSTIISKRTGGDFFGLMFSFAPLLLISFFVAPLVFSLPYILSAYAVHGRLAIKAYNLDVDRLNTVNPPSYTADRI